MDEHGDPPRRPFRRRRRLLIALAALAAAAAAVVVLGGGSDRPPEPDAFYEQPDPLPAAPAGAIVRSEAIARPPQRSTAYRILYRSRSYTGRPVALSALLLVPERPAPVDGRNVVALTHGTLGIDERCAASHGRRFFAHVDGLARFIRAGHVVVVPDYEGLGTRGPHPYLVGVANARATLDAVRAARRFQPAGASARFVAWGVGQGGHAALFTGQEAGRYAPELELAGVAVGAPMANLERLLARGRSTAAGRVAAAYVLATWSRVYPELRLERIVHGASRATIDELSELCLPLDHAPIGDALGNRAVRLDYRRSDPWSSAPLEALLARNAPGARAIPVPVIVTQGLADRLVRPAMTARFVRHLCRQGVAVQYRPSRGVAHADVGEKTAPYVSKWIARRFAGEPARSTC